MFSDRYVTFLDWKPVFFFMQRMFQMSAEIDVLELLTFFVPNCGSQ